MKKKSNWLRVVVWAVVVVAVAGLLYRAFQPVPVPVDAATIAPFEYLGLPLAFLWGWLVFAEWPALSTWVGCALIIGAGLFVFLREQARAAPSPGRRARWGRR